MSGVNFFTDNPCTNISSGFLSQCATHITYKEKNREHRAKKTYQENRETCNVHESIFFKNFLFFQF